ncbi:MAG: hypothetical protein AABX16_04650 [Nanoarchaeota archaeon]
MITRRNVLQGVGFLLLYDGMRQRPTLGYDKTSEENRKKRLEKLEYVLNPPKKEQHADIELQLDETKFVYIHPRKKLLRESKLIEIIPESLFEKIVNDGENVVYIAPKKYIVGDSQEKLKKMTENNTFPSLYPLWINNDSYFITLGTVSLEQKPQEDTSTIITYGENKKLKLIEHDKRLNLIRFRLLDISDFINPFDAARDFLKKGKVKWSESDFATNLRR